MHATITQRQANGGVFGQRQERYVDCAVEFTSEERQRIEANPDTLLKHVIAGGHDMSYGEFRWSPRSYAQSAPFLLVLLIAVGIFMLPRPIMDNLGSFLLWLALIAYCIFNYFNDHEGLAASDVVRVADVLDKPSFSIYVRNDTEGGAVIENIRKRLSELDVLLAMR